MNKPFRICIFVITLKLLLRSGVCKLSPEMQEAIRLIKDRAGKQPLEEMPFGLPNFTNGLRNLIYSDNPMPDKKVKVTAGYTTFIEWLKSFIPGYQPTLYGSESRPLVQWVLEKKNDIPAYTRNVIKPAGSGLGENPAYVIEPSRYIPPEDVVEKKKTAAEIYEEVKNSEEKMFI